MAWHCKPYPYGVAIAHFKPSLRTLKDTAAAAAAGVAGAATPGAATAAARAAIADEAAPVVYIPTVVD
jgi:hypothetical protein